MRVDLIDYTGKDTPDPVWYAADRMIYTKRTRTEMTPAGLGEIAAWPEERKMEELRYMSATVPSSWEFCDYTFQINSVTRVFTHQLVRTRYGVSFAQQAMQVLDMSQGPGWEYHIGPTIENNPEALELYVGTMEIIADSYKKLIAMGVKIEDARELLPLGILTNITMKMNLRGLCDMIRKRASPRNVSEFADVLRQMRELMISVHPWCKLFLYRTEDVVAAEMYQMLDKIPDKLVRTNFNKAIDQLLTNIGSGSEHEG
jgi:flavin-dependent thymidylate synthase